MVEGVVAIEEAKVPRTGSVAKQFAWAFRRPMNLEKVALLAQRVTGVALLVYLFFHIFVTGTITSGRAAWEAIMSILTSPWAHLGELLVVVGATFHAVNGIRVMLLETTTLVGRPLRPDYPYRAQSLGKGQQTILYTAMLMAALSTVAGIFILWGL